MRFIFLAFLLIFVLESKAIDNDFVCGKRAMRQGYHLGGPRLVHGFYPWNAALIDNDGNFFCGGILISKNEVITAAHCIQPKQSTHIFNTNDFKVILGYHNLSQQNEKERITVSVSKIRLHPDWLPNIDSYDADVAILVLEQEISFTKYIQPICIPAPQSLASEITNGVVVGFGIDEHGRTEDIPRIVDITIESYKNCSENSKFSSLISHRTFCGEHYDGTGLCSGDGGSGLIVLHQNTYYLRGIVSASLLNVLTGCDGNANSIFTDVTKFYGWINDSEFNDCNDAKLLKYVKELEKENRELKERI